MLKKIDMGKYFSYKNMIKTTDTRAIKDKKVIWPYYEKLIAKGKIKVRIIEKNDVNEISELWRMCYGELYGSSLKYEWVLYPEKYERNVVFKENWETDSVNKNFCMLVFELSDTGKLGGAWALWKDDRNLQVEFSLGITHPDIRKSKIGMRMVMIGNEYIKTLERESGAEYFTAFCETWHDTTQFLCFKQWGFKIGGIFPGQFTRWNGGQTEYRACEVHFYKFIGDAEKYVTKPEEWNILPEFKKLWETLEEINKSSRDILV